MPSDDDIKRMQHERDQRRLDADLKNFEHGNVVLHFLGGDCDGLELDGGSISTRGEMSVIQQVMWLTKGVIGNAFQSALSLRDSLEERELDAFREKEELREKGTISKGRHYFVSDRKTVDGKIHVTLQYGIHDITQH